MRKRSNTSNGSASSSGQGTLPLGNNFSPGISLTVISQIPRAKPTVVFDTYWRFSARRQNIFFRRLAGNPPPWTRDPVLLQYKFTNAYRASDRVCQYLIRYVIYSGDSSLNEVIFTT